jgi:hypothetical protein
MTTKTIFFWCPPGGNPPLSYTVPRDCFLVSVWCVGSPVTVSTQPELDDNIFVSAPAMYTEAFFINLETTELTLNIRAPILAGESIFIGCSQGSSRVLIVLEFPDEGPIEGRG